MTMAGRARFTEVAPAHKPLKRKRLSSVAIPMQLANALPDSFLYARLSQFEKRIDATMSEKLTRIQERVNQSEEGTHSVHKDKYRIHLYFTTENNNNAGKQQHHQEQHLGSQGQGPDQPLVQETTGDKGKGKGQVLLIYGKVERCGAPKPKANANEEDANKSSKDESQRKANSHAATAAGASASGMELDEKQEEEEEAKVYLTDVLRSVTVKGQKLNLNMDEQKAYDGVSFTWNNSSLMNSSPSASEDEGPVRLRHGKPSNCLRIDCSSLLPGSDLSVTWEVKGQAQKYILPDVLFKHLGVRVETKKNIITRLWNHMKLKHCLPTSIEPASVEFTSPALKAFFAEGDKGAAADMKVSAIGKKLSACLIETQKPKIKCIVPKGSESPDVVSLSFVADVEIDNKPAREKRINLVAAVGSTSVAIEEIDRDIRKLVEEIIQRKTRRNFFTGFSQSPVDFVSSLVDSQNRDLVVCECASDYFVGEPQHTTNNEHVLTFSFLFFRP
jgi:hypothetical protein